MLSKDRPSFEYPDASGVVRTWVPYCCKCDAVPTKHSLGCPRGALGYTNLGYHGGSGDNIEIPITDYSAYYCDEHAPEWAVPIGQYAQ